MGKESEVKLTGYVMRDYDDATAEVELGSVHPYQDSKEDCLVLHYGFKSVLSNLSELRMRADSFKQYFFEVNITVDIQKFMLGRVSEQELEDTRFLNLAYCNKALNSQIEGILGGEIRKNQTRHSVFSLDDVIKLHSDPLFAHLDVMVFPAAGKARGKPDSLAVLFYGDNIVEARVTNPNKGNPFDIVLPEALEGVVVSK